MPLDMDVYVINMPNRTDRKERMKTLLQEMGIYNAIFVTPVVVDTLDPRFPGLNKNQQSLNKTLIEKIFPTARTNAILIFEDDLMPMISPKDIVPRIQQIMKEAPKDWDMIFLEYCMEMCPLTKKVSPALRKGYKPYCTAAVIYKRDSLSKMSDCMIQEKKLTDFAYVECIKKGSIVPYIADPPLFAQDGTAQGDLKHMESKNIQYYMNFFLKMYDTDKTTSYPRLPHCIPSTSLIEYIRWNNVMLVCIGIIAIYAVFVIVRTKL
jgi:hypothetical protein